MYPLLYTGASGLVAGEKNLDAISNNLANAGTTAYRPERALFASYLDRAVVAGTPGGNPAGPRGVAFAGAWRDDTPGPLRETGNLFDVAIAGRGWFRVETPAGERLTRAGNFQRDARDRLVTAEGFPVLDDKGKPITIGAEGEVALVPDGTLTVDGEAVARIGVVDARLADLSREGGNLWKASATPTPIPAEETVLRQGFLEQSGVVAVEQLVAMIATQRMFEMNQKVVDVAANTIARRALELSGVR
jgi:flagellar basal body rod protein FlgG